MLYVLSLINSVFTLFMNIVQEPSLVFAHYDAHRIANPEFQNTCVCVGGGVGGEGEGEKRYVTGMYISSLSKT